MTHIREATDDDWEKIWPIFFEVVNKGDTYAYNPDTPKQEAFFIWLKRTKKTYVFEENGEILGTYYITTNYTRHVCNCGYMVSSAARGKGVATKMCIHSQNEARRLGYKAMQFNFVISTNVGAIKLWEKLGFDTVGRVPKAFKHPREGFVDALVMYKWLAD
ncbi:GNAT family N-acetyltransferase [Pseudemcibacter aquimaris]|uniref:GNAT family N-acetyltransferase n=1 Tax=Pseudemcibacter aquimaris TaxID=2857064 RepID=UPI002010D3BB|nr:GNAT family N-acetyltransferase [Pseudemcibacter aquimaris]MCC3859691.1 GNAT family N-acetyltransferase [Pseudemcibacter aquimaris]WDU60086.1 GNAT family N-acetyltransferase [Pseudemcibacter aquimaris]